LSEASSPKRVVFVHPDGLHQICGVLDGDVAPAVLHGPIQVLGRVYHGATLAQVTEHAVYYRPSPVVEGEVVEMPPAV
jgi:hypothetical protein